MRSLMIRENTPVFPPIQSEFVPGPELALPVREEPTAMNMALVQGPETVSMRASQPMLVSDRQNVRAAAKLRSQKEMRLRGWTPAVAYAETRQPGGKSSGSAGEAAREQVPEFVLPVVMETGTVSREFVMDNLAGNAQSDGAKQVSYDSNGGTANGTVRELRGW